MESKFYNYPIISICEVQSLYTIIINLTIYNKFNKKNKTEYRIIWKKYIDDIISIYNFKNYYDNFSFLVFLNKIFIILIN